MGLHGRGSTEPPSLTAAAASGHVEVEVPQEEEVAEEERETDRTTHFFSNNFVSRKPPIPSRVKSKRRTRGYFF